jgi:hypothetical protein
VKGEATMTTRTPPSVIAATARLALGLTMAIAATGSALAAPPGGTPVVQGAATDPAMANVTVRGRHFGTALPAVSLAGTRLQVLAGDDSRVLVRLPPGTAPGRYALQVTRADGASATAQVTLTAAATPTAARTASVPAGTPVLQSASAESDMAVVTIRGKNLGAGMPAVALGGKALRSLTFDGTTLVARLPPKTAPGKYTITVKRTDGASATLQATLGR